MKQIEFEEMESIAPVLCQDCGGLMRLIGSEPHPVEAKTDLLTYCCTACDGTTDQVTGKQRVTWNSARLRPTSAPVQTDHAADRQASVRLRCDCQPLAADPVQPIVPPLRRR